MLKLNLGCGANRLDGFVNVDSQPACAPDVVHDLETLPWPFEDDAADEIVLCHVLEHLGASTEGYHAILRELYRIAAPGATITVTVPHPRHDAFLTDPTHVRAIPGESFQHYSKEANRRWAESGAANTPLALYLDIDFAVERVEERLEEPWRSQLSQGQVSEEDVRFAARTLNNVICETEIVLRAVKPEALAKSA